MIEYVVTYRKRHSLLRIPVPEVLTSLEAARASARLCREARGRDVRIQPLGAAVAEE